MCDMIGQVSEIPVILEDISRFEELPNLEGIRERVHGCPACMLTVIRALDTCDYYEWDYKAEVARFMNDYNKENNSYYGYGEDEW